jgi:nitrite reductase/ring-hydroxylating ferredoxin subunit
MRLPQQTYCHRLPTWPAGHRHSRRRRCLVRRSPAEGAYSEGFANAKFTQDYCIECPSTGTLFSLKDGSIVSWYPNNPVLRMLTPQDTCRNLEIYPVRLTQEAIEVDMSGSTGGRGSTTKGGSDTSLENNNVYGLEPKTYVEGAAGGLDARAGQAGPAGWGPSLRAV